MWRSVCSGLAFGTWGGGLDLISHRPRWVRISFMTSWSSMTAMTQNHLGRPDRSRSRGSRLCHRGRNPSPEDGSQLVQRIPLCPSAVRQMKHDVQLPAPPVPLIIAARSVTDHRVVGVHPEMWDLRMEMSVAGFQRSAKPPSQCLQRFR